MDECDKYVGDLTNQLVIYLRRYVLMSAAMEKFLVVNRLDIIPNFWKEEANMMKREE